MVPGMHVFHLSRSFEDEAELVEPFLRSGLDAGEYCLWVSSDDTVEEWSQLFLSAGLITPDRPGRLAVLPGSDFQSGPPAPVKKARQLWSTIEEGLESYAGVRFAIDMTWILAEATEAGLVCHIEAAVDTLLRGESKVSTICHYRLDQLPPDVLVAGLRTHASILMDGEWRANPFYEAAKILNDEPRRNLPGPGFPTLDEALTTIASQPPNYHLITLSETAGSHSQVT
jgi:hypothetical protein